MPGIARTISPLVLVFPALALATAACVTVEPKPRPQAQEQAVPTDWFSQQEHQLARIPRRISTRPLQDDIVLVLDTGREWEALSPQTSTRLAEFRLPAPDGYEPATLTVFWFEGSGGTVDENLRRWAAQFETDSGADPLLEAEITMAGASGSATTRMQLEGVYVAETFPGSNQVMERPEWALDAGIYHTALGPVFLKTVGPAVTLRYQRSALDRLFSSLRIERART